MTTYIASSNKLLKAWLEKLGVNWDQCARVIIDISYDAAVTVYTTGFANREAFEVEPPPEILGARVVKHEMA